MGFFEGDKMIIRKNTFKAILRRQKKNSFSAIHLYNFDGMIDGITYMNKPVQLSKEAILEMISYSSALIFYDEEQDKLSIYDAAVFSYNITDPDLKNAVKQKVLLKKL